MRVWKLLGGCRHPETIRERRALVIGPETVQNVPHHVCLLCGHAEPIVARSADDHRRVQRLGALRLPVAVSQASAERQQA